MILVSNAEHGLPLLLVQVECCVVDCATTEGASIKFVDVGCCWREANPGSCTPVIDMRAGISADASCRGAVEIELRSRASAKVEKSGEEQR